jgi:ribosomal protein S18 acetylase RimI-like enzyme
MTKAELGDKNLVMDILTKSFDTNKSVNYVIKQDKKRSKRIRALMEYSYAICKQFGEVYLSNDKKACALTLLPDTQKTTLTTIFLDLRLAIISLGLTRAIKALERAMLIKKQYPASSVYYIWLIGVHPEAQNNGIGTTLLSEIIANAQILNRPIYLETSMSENLPFYKKMGFEVYAELESPHSIFFLRKNNN